MPAYYGAFSAGVKHRDGENRVRSGEFIGLDSGNWLMNFQYSAQQYIEFFYRSSFPFSDGMGSECESEWREKRKYRNFVDDRESKVVVAHKNIVVFFKRNGRIQLLKSLCWNPK